MICTCNPSAREVDCGGSVPASLITWQSPDQWDTLCQRTRWMVAEAKQQLSLSSCFHMCVHICALNTHEHIHTYTYKERRQLLAQAPIEMTPAWFWTDFTEEHMETSLKFGRTSPKLLTSMLTSMQWKSRNKKLPLPIDDTSLSVHKSRFLDTHRSALLDVTILCCKSSGEGIPENKQSSFAFCPCMVAVLTSVDV